MNVNVLCPVGLFVYKARVRMLKTQACAPNQKRKGGGSALAMRITRSDSMVPWQSPLRMHASPSAVWRTVTRLAGKWFVFRGQKICRSSLVQNDSPPVKSSLSLPSPLLSILSLSLLSLSPSLSPSFKGTHTHTCIVEPKPILLVGPLPLHPVASSWVGKTCGAYYQWKEKHAWPPKAPNWEIWVGHACFLPCKAHQSSEIDDMRVRQRSTSRYVSTVIISGGKIALKPKRRGNQPIYVTGNKTCTPTTQPDSRLLTVL